jgi:hypothetical protein
LKIRHWRGGRACEDPAFAGMLREAGMSFPPSDRTVDIRSAFLEKVDDTARDAARAGARTSPRTRGYLVPALSGLVVALVAVAVIFMSFGFASVSAMPGSTLYSVKRTVERVQLSFLGGKEKVDALLKQTDKRMCELEYARSRGMSSWLYPLASDAQEDVDEAKQEGASLNKKDEGDVDRKAGDIVIEHEQEVRDSVGEMPAQQRESVEQWLDREVHEREIEQQRDGGTPGGSEERPPAPTAVVKYVVNEHTSEKGAAEVESATRQASLEQPQAETREATAPSTVEEHSSQVTSESSTVAQRDERYEADAKTAPQESKGRDSSYAERTD